MIKFSDFQIFSSYLHCIPIRQNGGSYILATDASADSILSVWQWQWGHLLGKVAVSIFVFHMNFLFAFEFGTERNGPVQIVN